MAKWRNNGVIYTISDDLDVSSAAVVSHLAAIVRALEGKMPADIFGVDVPLDVVHFTDQAPDTCGCVVRYAWRDDGSARVHVGHKSITVCPRHVGASNPVSHYAAVKSHNDAKNNQVAAYALANNIPPTAVIWSLNEKTGTYVASHVANAVSAVN